ncbi:MAG: condensation domain-containing protein, partial [Acidobacteriota bacterium]|nr:condensation domain-containing protein [Acidobacteriota bacterium]
MGNDTQIRPELHPEQPRKRSTEQGYRLSFGPESLWYLDKLSPHSPVYNVPFLSRLRGRLNAYAFEKALNALVDRQAVLRCVFMPSGGAPVALVLKRRSVDLKKIDLRHLSESQRQSEARQLARLEASRRFDLTRDAMLRPFLFQLGEEEYLFLAITHHIVFELGSLDILYRDLSSFYNAFAADQPPDLPPLTFQDSDFSLWQRRHLEGERLERLNQYWRQQLTGAPLVRLPLDFPRPRVHSNRGVRHFFSLPPDLCSTPITEFFRGLGTTPYRGLLAAFYIFLYGYSGETDICVGSPFASRCPGIENTIGFFANTLVLRTNLSGHPTFREVIRKVDRVALRAIANSDLSFEKIVEAVRPPRDPSRTPLFQISFRGRTRPYACLQFDGLVADRPEFIDNGTAKFDLALELEATTGKA